MLEPLDAIMKLSARTTAMNRNLKPVPDRSIWGDIAVHGSEVNARSSGRDSGV